MALFRYQCWHWQYILEAKGALLENRCQNIHFGLAIYAVIPVSVHVSKMIYSTYQESIDATIDEANDLVDESEASKDDDKDSKKSKGF